MLPQEPSSFRPEPCQSSLSLSESFLNSLCLLLLAIACAFPIALETGVVQAGEARDVDFINSTLYCPFTLRGLAWKGGAGDLGTSLFAPPCSHLLVRPLSCPSVPAHFSSLSKPGSWWRGVLGPISQVGRWVWENNAETTKRARGGPAGESRLELDCQSLAWLVRLPWSGIPKSVLL